MVDYCVARSMPDWACLVWSWFFANVALDSCLNLTRSWRNWGGSRHSFATVHWSIGSRGCDYCSLTAMPFFTSPYNGCYSSQVTALCPFPSSLLLVRHAQTSQTCDRAWLSRPCLSTSHNHAEPIRRILPSKCPSALNHRSLWMFDTGFSNYTPTSA